MQRVNVQAARQAQKKKKAKPKSTHGNAGRVPATAFKKGNQVSVGNHGGGTAKAHKRFITMSFINSLKEDIVRIKKDMEGKTIKDRNGKDVKEKVTKERLLIESLYKAITVDRNPAMARLIVEMIEGRSPTPIDVRQRSFNINTNMSLSEASKVYLESIKRTSLDEDEEEEEE